MSEINYQSLREVAERAIPAMERLLMLPVDDDLLSEQELKDYGVDIDALNAFKFLAGPETVLALLDENERLCRELIARNGEIEGLREWAEELEAREVALPVASCIVEDGCMCVDGFSEYVGHSLPDGMHELYAAPPASVAPDGWISCSERMPNTKTAVLVAVEFDRKGDWRMKWATYIPGHPDANDGWIIPGASWKPSHWMPLPEPPQEVNR
ncbi:DUF551 domain-containing protein [Escherichia coli]